MGGADLIILYKAAACTLAAAIRWKTEGTNLPGWLEGLLLIFPVVLLAGRAFERHEFVTMVFFACTLLLLHRVDERPPSDLLAGADATTVDQLPYPVR